MLLKLQRFALKPKPIETLKALQSNAFKVSIMVRLIGNCCKSLLHSGKLRTTKNQIDDGQVLVLSRGELIGYSHFYR